MVDRLFAHADFSVDVVYRAGGVGGGVTVKAMRHLPTRDAGLGVIGVRTPSDLFEVTKAAVAAPAIGDTLQLGASVWRVHAAPDLDDGGLVWTLDVVPV
jgi:hypothetical protein